MEQPSTQPIAQPATPTPEWTNAKRILFRFCCAWFLLYIFFNPNGILPGVDEAFNFYITPFHRLIPWIGSHILHLSHPIVIIENNGSGDTTYDYVVLLAVSVLAALACAVWTLLDRRRPSYSTLFYWVTTILRYYLGITMLTYGFAKVFKMQFPSPGLYTLLERYGDSSPMGLAWTYMGYSNGYNLFTGFAEIIPGTLLFFRRTTAIGAFLAFIVAANITAMNYSFDIPVKLLSTTMVLMSLFLLGDNIRRLFNLFFREGTTRLFIVPRAPIRRKGVRITLVVIKSVLVIYAFFGTAWLSLKARQDYGDHAPHTALYGIYNTRSFLYNKDSLAPIQTDTIRWQQLVIDGSPTFAYAVIKMMNDSAHGYRASTDTMHHVLTISDYRDSTKKWRLHYNYPVTDSLILWGTRFSGTRADSIRIALSRYPLNNFRLNSRGFNWINEVPYNR
ncbi:MAG TPA: hypothetical protein VG101_17175 [Puia sp.]|jgi:uncharacterized membrane protein YphA (DoxX/SURF4 family)|nr:hypothetical protein [Puia sp.]